MQCICESVTAACMEMTAVGLASADAAATPLMTTMTASAILVSSRAALIEKESVVAKKMILKWFGSHLRCRCR